MKIGTDVSLTVCRCEGYLVAEYKISELIKNGELDKDVPVRLTRSNPSAWYDNGKVKIGASNPYLLDEYLSYNDVLEAYLMDRKAIDSYMGNDDISAPYIDYTSDNFNPTIHDLLGLADIVDSYRGLATH